MIPFTEVITVNNWRRFLHSLSTTGGDVFVLFVLFMIVMCGYLKTTDHFFRDAMTLVLGGLLGLLKGKSNQNIVEVDKDSKAKIITVEQKPQE